MAMSLAAKKNGRTRRRRSGRHEPMAEINVTPMVDVMLVLLIVFMVAAPLLTVGVPIELPETQANSLNTDSKPITVSVTPDGQIYLREEVVLLEEIVARLAEITVNGTEDRIYMRGDASANYGAVMKVMGVLSSAGYSSIGLITEQEQGQ
jgi:biopolymer transport protein TolR